MRKPVAEQDRWKDHPEAIRRMGNAGDKILKILVRGVQGPDEAITTIIGVIACIYEKEIVGDMTIEELVEDIKLGLKEYLRLENDDPTAVH